MELRHLRYFIAVAAEQNFTRAAKRLGMQQPPLSQQIRALEDELGFALFLRHRKGVDLTAGGVVFLKEAQAILDNVEQASQRALRAASGVEGVLSVGMSSSAASHPLIPAILRAHRATRPGVSIAFHEGNAAELTSAILAGQIDLGFLRMPTSRPEGVEFHQLAAEEMLLVLPAGHPLLPPGAGEDMPAIPLAALRGEPFILVRKPGAAGMYANLLDACKRAGFTPHVAAEVDRMLTNICLVASGVGVSAAPASMRHFQADLVAYCRIADDDEALRAPLTLACRAGDASPLVRHFVAEAGRLKSMHHGSSDAAI